MKFLSYSISNKISYGVLIKDHVIDLGSRIPNSTLLSIISDGSLVKIQDQALTYDPDFSVSEIQFHKPLLNGGRFICVGKNYKGHLAEANMKLPDFPSMFLRLDTSVVAHNENLISPKVSTHFDFEGELAIIIGKPGRHIKRADALSYIAGYSIFMDGSIRDFQFQHSLTAGKNFYATGSFGPYFVTSDEVGDPTQLDLKTRLNGIEVQHTKTDDLIFDIPCLIEYISSYTNLLPGDVIATGTPEGVGFARTPPLWMKAGDHLEVEISKLGTLSHLVIDEV
ncbi:MAG: fumarylacetoacetate hydrolase family protein [Betaproteobacteria bacterium]|jgi:2-keto-4-pentenoate hydratase/2-oxohepta-3-ene-1,7-dioic acid hydratase in catechol pathway